MSLETTRPVPDEYSQYPSLPKDNPSFYQAKATVLVEALVTHLSVTLDLYSVKDRRVMVFLLARSAEELAAKLALDTTKGSPPNSVSTGYLRRMHETWRATVSRLWQDQRFLRCLSRLTDQQKLRFEVMMTRMVFDLFHKAMSDHDFTVMCADKVFLPFTYNDRNQS